MMGMRQIEGGAPNNFLLLKNERLAAPFGSTVKKGWLHGERGKSNCFDHFFRGESIRVRRADFRKLQIIKIKITK
jgi:hypothetical protein